MSGIFKNEHFYKARRSWGKYIKEGEYYKVYVEVGNHNEQLCYIKKDTVMPHIPDFVFDADSELLYSLPGKSSNPNTEYITVIQGEVVTRTIKVNEQMLTLSNEAADWLKGLMQNPLNGCLPEDEDERSRAIREAIFHSLKWMHETDEPISDEGMSWIG